MKLQIRQRTLLVVLSCSLLSLLLFSGLTMYSLYQLKQAALLEGDEIAARASSLAETALREQIGSALETTAQDNADKIDLQLGSVRDHIGLLAGAMTQIASHPADYPERHVPEAQRSMAGRTEVYLTYSAEAPLEVSPLELRQEIARTANIADLLQLIQRKLPVADSVYAASKHGFMLQADTHADLFFADSDTNVPSCFEMLERPWYRKAKAADRIIFTDVVRDYHRDASFVGCAAPYYADGVFAGVVGMGCLLKETEQIVLAFRSGGQGISFVLNEAGQIIFSTAAEGELSAVGSIGANGDLRHARQPELSKLAAKVLAGEKGRAELVLEGREYMAAYVPLREVDWCFVMLTPMDSLLAPVLENHQLIADQTQIHIDSLDNKMRQSIFLLFILGAGIAAVVSLAGLRLSDRLVTPIRRLNSQVRAIAQGNMEQEIEVCRTGDEVESLSLTFNAMSRHLKQYIAEIRRTAAERERIAAELQVGADIQQSLLPKAFLADRREFEIYAAMYPAREVGGDFYDFYLLADRYLVISIGDVSGKGIPAAMFMVVTRTLLRNFTLGMDPGEPLSEVIAHVNNSLAGENAAMMFATVFHGILDIRTGHFVYVNAGHNAPLLYRHREDSFAFVRGRHGCMLGIREDTVFPQEEMELQPEDMLFLYTDGVTEAMDAEGQLYSGEALRECLSQSEASAPLPKILQAVRASVGSHAAGTVQSDDIAMLALRYGKK